MIHKNCTNAAFAPRLIVLAGAVMSASASFGHFVANAYSRSGRVEDGRGSLGHAATLRFPSPLIEPDVRISRIRLSDWLHREAHGASDQGKRSRRNTPRSP